MTLVHAIALRDGLIYYSAARIVAGPRQPRLHVARIGGRRCMPHARVVAGIVAGNVDGITIGPPVAIVGQIQPGLAVWTGAGSRSWTRRGGGVVDAGRNRMRDECNKHRNHVRRRTDSGGLLVSAKIDATSILSPVIKVGVCNVPARRQVLRHMYMLIGLQKRLDKERPRELRGV